MTNPIDAAIAEAEKQAQQTPAASNQIVDVQSTGTNPQTGVQSYSTPQALTLDDLEQGAMSVDDWLKVKEFGLLIGSKPDLIETIKVSIDVGGGEMTPFQGIRYGEPPVYLKTYDNVNAVSGGSWEAAKNKAQLIDPTTQPYLGCDIQMTLLEDAVSAKGVVVAEKGLRLGHSTSITNRNAIADFLKACGKANLKDNKVEVLIGFQAKRNKNNQGWGIITLDLIGPAA